LKKFDPLYWKRDKANKGKIVEGTGPTLYPKLIVSKQKPKKNQDDKKMLQDDENSEQKLKIVSQFYDSSTGKDIEGLDLIGKYCYVTECAIKIESIYFGAGKITLQFKVYEAGIELLNSGMKPLLKRPVAQEIVEIEKNDIPSERDGSIDDANESEAPIIQEKTVRKTKKVLRKKEEPVN
jgi:hypothetical protein